MPLRPGHPCGQPGCPVITTDPHCPAHTKPRQKDPRQERFYNSGHWKKLRALVRAQEPICMVCKRKPSVAVDHVNSDFTDNRRENLQGICRACHDEKSGKDHRRKQG